MTTFTLDTNCLIDVAESRPAAAAVLALLAAYQGGSADLALVASSASERQQGGDFLSSLTAFETRRSKLGFGGLPLLPSIARGDISFFGHSLWGSEEGVTRERVLYETLFPTSAFEWADYAAERGVTIDDRGSPAYYRWRNQILDVQALWAHDHAERLVFVTSDKRLGALNGHPAFSGRTVCVPDDALSFLE